MPTGRPRHRTPCPRPARARAGFRPGRHRPRCPGWTEAAATKSAPQATRSGERAGSVRAEQHDGGEQKELREDQPAAPPPQPSATRTARRAHRPAAPTGIGSNRACRPARAGRWRRDRHRPRASTRSGWSRRAPAAGRRKSRARGDDQDARAADRRRCPRASEARGAAGSAGVEARLPVRVMERC